LLLLACLAAEVPTAIAADMPGTYPPPLLDDFYLRGSSPRGYVRRDGFYLGA